MQGRMARYDVRNDGAGPYAVFYCDRCGREFRSQPNVKATIAKEVTKSALGGLFGSIPVLGDAVDTVSGYPRYDTTLTSQQLDAAWAQMKSVFHECPTCLQIVCPSDWDPQSSFCTEDTPRRQEIAQAEAQQAAATMKGFADALGLGSAITQAQAAQAAQPQTAAPCANCGSETRGAKFCPECGTPVAAAAKCRNCGADTHGAKFCPECGTKQGV